MRKAKWLAAVLAVGVLIPYCEQLHRVVGPEPAQAGPDVVGQAGGGPRHLGAPGQRGVEQAGRPGEGNGIGEERDGPGPGGQPP